MEAFDSGEQVEVGVNVASDYGRVMTVRRQLGCGFFWRDCFNFNGKSVSRAWWLNKETAPSLALERARGNGADDCGLWASSGPGDEIRCTSSLEDGKFECGGSPSEKLIRVRRLRPLSARPINLYGPLFLSSSFIFSKSRACKGGWFRWVYVRQ